MKVKLIVGAPAAPGQAHDPGGECYLEVANGFATLWQEGHRMRGSESINVDGVQVTVEILEP